MADSMSGTVIGALGTVCTVLLSAAGLNLKQMSQHNTRLVEALDQRNKDVDALNVQRHEDGRKYGAQILALTTELGTVRAELATVKAAATDVERLQREAKNDEELIVSLKVAVEKANLEKMQLKHRLDELKSQADALEKSLREAITPGEDGCSSCDLAKIKEKVEEKNDE